MNKDKNTILSNEDIVKTLQRIERKLDKLDTQSNLSKEYLTTQEACMFLGCQRTMIWKLVNDGKLQKNKLDNGRTYYASAELKKLIENPIQDAA